MASNYTEDTEPQEIKGLSAWILLFMVIIAPLTGWRKLKSSDLTGQEFASRVLYPILALTAISEFAEGLYADVTLQQMLVHAIVSFASCFFSYFIIQMLYRVLCSGDTLTAVSSAFGQKFTTVILSTFCIYLIVYNLVPMLDSILVFLPLYTVYLMFKGLPTLLLPRLRTRKTLAIVLGLNLLIPLAMYFAMDSVL